jgi:hypothetical protein
MNFFFFLCFFNEGVSLFYCDESYVIFDEDKEEEEQIKEENLQKSPVLSSTAFSLSGTINSEASELKSKSGVSFENKSNSSKSSTAPLLIVPSVVNVSKQQLVLDSLEIPGDDPRDSFISSPIPVQSSSPFSISTSESSKPLSSPHPPSIPSTKKEEKPKKKKKEPGMHELYLRRYIFQVLFYSFLFCLVLIIIILILIINYVNIKTIDPIPFCTPAILVKGGNNDYRTEEDVGSDDIKTYGEKKMSGINNEDIEKVKDSSSISNKEIISMMGLYTEGFDKKGLLNFFTHK